MEWRLPGAGGGEEGNRELFNVHKVPVRDDDPVLEMDNGEGCTTNECT